MTRAIVVLLCVMACGCAGRPAIGVVITNSPESIECGPPSGRSTCR